MSNEEIAKEAARRGCLADTLETVILDAINRAQSDDKAEIARLRKELSNIATADLDDWHEGFKEPIDFMMWAQSRAHAALDSARKQP